MPSKELEAVIDLLTSRQQGSKLTIQDARTGKTIFMRNIGYDTQVDVTLEQWDEMIHVWPISAPVLPDGQQAIDRIGEFVRQHQNVATAAD